jgi:hypothetical protein
VSCRPILLSQDTSVFTCALTVMLTQVISCKSLLILMQITPFAGIDCNSYIGFMYCYYFISIVIKIYRPTNVTSRVLA